MASILDSFKIICPQGRAAWRSWLSRNHGRSPGIWLIYLKKSSGRQNLTVGEAVEEALCFGWIDSKVNAIDAGSYKQVFTPRKKGSTWSKINKQRVEKLIELGRMTPAGMLKIDEAKGDGSWDRITDVEDLVMPDDLSKALAESKIEEKFYALPVSERKQFLWYLGSAKRPATRERRLGEILSVLQEGGTIQDMLVRRRPSPRA